MSIRLRPFSFSSYRSLALLGGVALVLLGLFHFYHRWTKKTDTQAWHDYQHSLSLKRAPASSSPAVEHLRATLSEISVRKILLSCFAKENEKKCYDDQLGIAFEGVYRDQGRSVDPEWSAVAYEQEKSKFLAENPYESARHEVSVFHYLLFHGLEQDSEREATHLFEACEKTAAETGRSDLKLDVATCLNKGWAETESRILEINANRQDLVIETAEAKKWISLNQIGPLIQKHWSDWTVSHLKIESEIFGQVEKNWHEQAKNELLLDFKWLESEKSRSLSELCVTTGVAKWVPYFKEKYLYLNLEARLGLVLAPICQEISGNEEVLKAFKQAHEKNFEKKIEEWLPALDAFVLEQADQRRELCLQKNASASGVSRCVLPQWITHLERNAISVWTENSELHAWVSGNHEAQALLQVKAESYLSHKRLALQDEFLR